MVSNVTYSGGSYGPAFGNAATKNVGTDVNTVADGKALADLTGVIADLAQDAFGGAVLTLPNDPTTSDIAVGTIRVVENTTTGVTSLWTNNDGAMVNAISAYAAQKGENSDITSLTGLTGPVTTPGAVTAGTLAGDGSAGVKVLAPNANTPIPLGSLLSRVDVRGFYGASGDASDATAINAAGAAAVANGGTLTLSGKTYSLLSDIMLPPGNLRMDLDAKAQFSGGRLRVDNLIPWQITPIFARSLIAHTYGPETGAYGNIFQGADYAKATQGGQVVVARFGEGDAAGNNAEGWGGNFVGVASASGGRAIGAEINSVVTAAGGSANGLVIASAGSFPSASAIQIQSNETASAFSDVLIFNSALKNITSGALIKIAGGTPANAILSQNATYTSSEVDLPSFLVGATVSGANSRVRLDGSNSGNPTISAAGYSGSSATNANLNLSALGTGGVQSVVNGSVGFAVRGSAGSTLNSGLQVVPSVSGAPTLAAFGSGASPASNADINLQALGTGSFKATTNGQPAFQVSGATTNANSGVQVIPSSSGNPIISSLGIGASPPSNAPLYLQGIGQQGVGVLTQGTIAFDVAGSATPPTSRINVQASDSGNPMISVLGTSGNPTANANLNLASLGGGSVQAVVNGYVGFAVAGTAGANSGVKVFPSTSGAPLIAPSGAGGSPAANADLALSGMGTGVVRAVTPFSVTSVTLAAGGTTQSSAPGLSSDINIVTSGTGGVRLQANTGQQQRVANRSGASINVYPPSGAQIDANAANAAVTVANGGNATFVFTSATQAYQVQ